MDDVIRQCMACRKKDEKRNLMRIVRMPGGVIEFDPEQRKEGRGAYLCANPECLTKAKSRHLIGEEFGLPDPSDVYIELAETLLIGKGSSVEAFIGFAVRSRRCVMGTTAVEQAFERNRIRLLVLSENAGPSTRTKMEGLAEGKDIPVSIYRGSRTLEALTGKANCQVLGILDGNFARKIQEALKNPGNDGLDG
jgi:predicted RNA-binding protein YlxR (DUF448 family)/ribosomal protein L7Ae-like RNA K-turn-binding protein